MKEVADQSILLAEARASLLTIQKAVKKDRDTELRRYMSEERHIWDDLKPVGINLYDEFEEECNLRRAAELTPLAKQLNKAKRRRSEVSTSLFLTSYFFRLLPNNEEKNFVARAMFFL